MDKTPPTVLFKNLENGKRYAQKTLPIYIRANDNLKLSEVAVYLDGVCAADWTGDALEEVLTAGEDFHIVVPGDTKDVHQIEAMAKDAAGNESRILVDSFVVYEGVLERLQEHMGAILGAAIIVAVLAGGCVLYVQKRKRAAVSGQR